MRRFEDRHQVARSPLHSSKLAKIVTSIARQPTRSSAPAVR